MKEDSHNLEKMSEEEFDQCLTIDDTKKFIKADDEKLMMSLIEPKFLKGTAKVLTIGAKKYSVDNWKNCDDRQRYEDALLRHIYDYLSGTKCDDESGVSHLYHAACNLMFLDHFDREGK